jgi:hypothetical protein
MHDIVHRAIMRLLCRHCGESRVHGTAPADLVLELGLKQITAIRDWQAA